MLVLPATPAMGALSLFPTPTSLAVALKGALPPERDALVRLWLTEGIPKAFESCPLAYEYYRVCLAAAAGVPEKNVTVVGSVRFGYSLSPEKFGTALNAESDLDATIVDSSLFATAEAAFNAWQSDIQNERTAPSNPSESRYWAEAATLVPTHLQRGFIGTKYLPARSTFVRSLHDPLVRVVQKWRTLNNAPKLSASKSSVRIYKNWHAAVRQISVNIAHLAGRLP